MRAKHLSLALLAACPLASFSQADAPRVLNTHFNYTATVPAVPDGAKNLRIWLPLPSDSELQTVTNLSVDYPGEYRITRDRVEGNRMVFVEIENPKAPVDIGVSFDVARKTAGVVDVRTDPGPDANRYLLPNRLIPIDGRFAELGEEVAGGGRNALAKMRMIFNHVVATMQYDYKKESPHLGDGDVAFVCDYKKGNCSDLHSYVISLARSQGVPIYLEYGFPITGIPVDSPLKASGTIGGYHCWTWFYDRDRGWLPLDASDGRRWLDSGKPEIKDKLVGELVLERSAVAFSRGRDIVLEPAQKAGPLNYFIYPYAEADGKAVEAKWSLSYRLIGQDSIQSQLDALRKIVSDQQAEIDALKAGKGGSTAAPAAVKTQGGDNLSFYGFFRGDAIIDSQKPNNAQAPQWVPSGTGADNFTLHPRLTRLGLDVKGQKAGPFEVSGKIEIDFQGGGSESRNTPRARHLFVQAKQGASTWLVGQTWDLISPLFPSPNDDTLMWNAGNLGDRRPQIRYTYTGQEGLSFAAMLGLTGAVDAKDLDGDGTRDGEASGMPGVQARLGYKGPKGGAGIWGGYSREKTATPVGGSTRFDSSVIGIDWQWFFGQLDVAGEAWTGKNLSDVRGGIGQGVNVGSGDEISSTGGWLEIGYKPSNTYRIAVGYTVDNPKDADVGTGRLKNSALYLHNKWNVGSGIEIGANYLHWLTDWAGLPRGRDSRFNFFLMRKF